MLREVSDESEKPRIGVVLSSGGVRGVYAHTGFMQAIQNLEIPVSASTGCSAGALVGGFIASGTSLEDWAANLAGITSRSFWTPDSLPRFIWEMTVHKGRGYTGLSDTSAALQFTRDNLSANTFDECLYPFNVLAVNLGTGRKEVFFEGELAPRMTASAAMPVLYDPVRIDGQYYCDGALIDFAPTDAICCRHQLDVVIVHHVSQQFSVHSDIDAALRDRWALLEVVDRLVFRHIPWYLSDKPLSLHLCPCDCGAIVIVIEPVLKVMRWPVTTGGDAVRRSAREQTEALLQPYLDAILNDPRKRLPVNENTTENPFGGCGNSVTH
ncbi:MAG: patatin-like phospholipase family protein [Gammaproteobacteria bacterium]